MSIYSKSPETTVQHISKLKSRGLLISDEEKAESFLTYIGYYRLSAYTLPFETSSAGGVRTHQLKTGTTFEDIIKLYYFDRHLRLLFLDAIEKIEVISEPQYRLEAMGFPADWQDRQIWKR